MSGPVIIAAGGTGGHLFPALAVAEELRHRGREVVAVTDKRGGDLASRLEGVPVHRLRASAISGRGLAGKISGAVDLLRGTFEAKRLLRRLAPSGVVGFGGYPTVPPLFAAYQLGLPSLLHEQNAVLGRANRLLSGRVSLVATSFEQTEGAEDCQTLLCGNPVRSAIAALSQETYRSPGDRDPFRLLVFGGSQGARVLSQILPQALRHLPHPARRRLVVEQQCRHEDLDGVRAAYDEMGVEATVATFFEDMDVRLASAHLVISRSGASTIAELAAAGRPAMLVPYPHATDDHQSANARAVEAAGAGWLMPEEAFSGEALAARLETFLASPMALVEAAAAARRFARPDAASTLADAIDRLTGTNGHHGGPELREQAA
ncbi:MAG: undecaprenyldiphospho-muramoylpentapeptide beta-N-acetylglucosaminyltransferase [Rhodospirillaceae bacterium]|jgi:UDP-N-acetylglucosamine--N-acetylmuramyl-(pentapeptide) pyrophosphoryl-undecaprenol N-acetylglucosamine transferase|nr:undecaprenyldiphospho-muramoylpentapeptide beta-N-acetylglucosaminyltransferase [Rhodospirillaceae bacterium]MBT6511427.1 undecaprenyldiphospho-muramoylpentapeptide beta-N-acetylglucosaminyltransferase [Rhodospirillaceae bacterium]MBT7613433.1 undecaprenyldiphospho-muramoylpentapeptide beta-N-acetylglucosaminyltransferase [Rhodospirillaceae bacterium]